MAKVLDLGPKLKKKKEDDARKFDNLDQFVEYLNSVHAANLDEAFEEHDAFTDDANMADIYGTVFAPAQDDMYTTFTTEMKNIGENKTELNKKNHEDGLKKALKASLEKYFEKVQPSVLESIKEMNMDDEEAYDQLILSYDKHVGAGQIQGVDGLKDIIDAALKNKKSIGELNQTMYQNKATHSQAAMTVLQNKHVNKNFSGYEPQKIAAYLKPQLEKAGAEIEDKTGFLNATLGDLIGLRSAVIEKKGHKYLKKKDDNYEAVA
jgi:hypothetical protein